MFAMKGTIRIGINAISARMGGGQTYVQNLLEYASELEEIKVFLIVSHENAEPYSRFNIDRVYCETASRKILQRTLWELSNLKRIFKEKRLDVLFSPSGSLNMFNPDAITTAVTFQNMMVFNKEERRRPGMRLKTRLRLAALEKSFKRSFESTDLIICLNEYAEKVINGNINNRRGKIMVIPHGLDNNFRTYRGENVPISKHTPDCEYFLYVSTIAPYKAHMEVVEAYHHLCQQRKTEEKLILVGSEYPYYGKMLRKKIFNLGLNDKVILTGQIPYLDMPSLYFYSKANIFASRCENFPYVLLECLGSGRPLFLTNRQPMPEIAGDCAFYFNPNKPEELTEVMLHTLNDDGLMEEMGKKAYERSLEFDWRETAQRTFGAFSDLIGRDV